MAKKDFYLVLLEDQGSFGHSLFLTKAEADRFSSQALKSGYHVAVLCVNKLFESDRYTVCPVKGE